MGGDASKPLDVEKLWKKYDQDGGGVLDQTECTQLIAELWKRQKIKKPLTQEFVAGILEELDENGDGQIVKEEFIELFGELWKQQVALLKVPPGAAGKAQGKAATAKPGKPASSKSGDSSPVTSETEEDAKNKSSSSAGRAVKAQPAVSSKAATKSQSTGAPEVEEHFTGSQWPRPDPSLAADEWLTCPHCHMELDPRELDSLRVPPESLTVLPGPYPTGVPQVLGIPPGARVYGQVPATFFQTPHGWWAGGQQALPANAIPGSPASSFPSRPATPVADSRFQFPRR